MAINEETLLDEQYKTHNENSSNESALKGKVSPGKKLAYAAAGAIIGSGATFAGHTAAATNDEEPEAKVEEDNTDAAANANQATEPKVEDAPTPEDSIIATATGVRVAQVDDDASFAQAFTDARSQVGPGGVFEWHGRAYSTYYKDEWDVMSPQEHHNYQASINYEDVLSNDAQAQHYNNMAHQPMHEHTAQPTEQATAEQTQESVLPTNPQDSEIKVIAMGQTDINRDGVPESSAVVDIDGHQILIVDIDQDGTADVALYDRDNSGTLSEGEVVDLRGENIHMPQAQDPGNDYLDQASTEPDYMNDADAGLYDA